MIKENERDRILRILNINIDQYRQDVEEGHDILSGVMCEQYGFIKGYIFALYDVDLLNEDEFKMYIERLSYLKNQGTI